MVKLPHNDEVCGSSRFGCLCSRNDKEVYMKIRKRDGSEVTFNKQNIVNAITNANEKVRLDERLTVQEIKDIAKRIEGVCKGSPVSIGYKDIQKMVETAIMEAGKFEVATEYITYRYQKALGERKNTIDDRILSLLHGVNEDIQQENGNKNPNIVSTMRDYMAGEVSKDISQRYLIPTDIYDAHKEGIIHFHDMDYFAMPISNCCLINLEDMLQNGTVISGTTIDKPKTFSTACNIASQVVAQVASSQYGGQTITLSHLAPFVEETRKTLRKRFSKNCEMSEKQLSELVESETLKDIEDGIQTLQYQILTLQTTNGQTPFVSVCMYLNEVEDGQTKSDLALVIEAALRQRIVGVKNEAGVFYANPFPKLLYVLEEDNVTEDGKYWYLTKLAAECTVKRMVPDYISEKIMKELKVDKTGVGRCYPCMGCRSFLTPYIQAAHQEVKTYYTDHVWVDENGEEFTFEQLEQAVGKDMAVVIPYNGTVRKVTKMDGHKCRVTYDVGAKPKYYGRFNQGVVTLNLPYVALLAHGNMKDFWYELDEKLELCHRALRLRHEHLRGVKSDVAPILWQHGAFARLEKGETIDELLYNGYSTISLGYAGLYETVKILIGKSLTDEEGLELGQKIMKKLNSKCADWKKIEKIDYSVYGTPIENTTQKFSEALSRRFGVIEGISDRSYITNSYHVPVFEEIDAFKKIDVESVLQRLSPGGAVSYIETPNMVNNQEAILTVIKYIYDHIMYCELNSRLDWCNKCGGVGTISMKKDEDGKLHWHCDNCGNEDLGSMNVVRRLCRIFVQR